jgi:hypothetical protein
LPSNNLVKALSSKNGKGRGKNQTFHAGQEDEPNFSYNFKYNHDTDTIDRPKMTLCEKTGKLPGDNFSGRFESVNKISAQQHSAGPANSNYLFENYKKNGGNEKFEQKQTLSDFTKKNLDAKYQDYGHSPNNENLNPNIVQNSSSRKENFTPIPTTNYYSTQKLPNVGLSTKNNETCNFTLSKP